MNQLLIVLTLLLGSHTGFASEPKATHKQSCACKHDSNPLSKEQILGETDVDTFKKLLSQNALYALLTALDASNPVSTRNLKYVATFNEMHTQNQTLKQLLTEMEVRNQLLMEHRTHKGGATDG